MDEQDGARHAMVTGASTGIGRAIAVALGRLGWRVSLGARDGARTGEAADEVRGAGGSAFSRTLDVGDAVSVGTFLTAAEAALGPVDVLVNNAGTAWPGDLAVIDPARLEQIVRTNLLGAMFATRAVLGSLLGRHGRGDIVFVSSDAAHSPRPSFIAYGATKAAVEHVARGVAFETEGTGIRVTVVRLGPTLTGFADAWGDPAVFGAMIERWRRFGNQRHWGTLTPEDAARAVVASVTAPRGVRFDTVEVQPEAPVGATRGAGGSPTES